MGPTNQAEHLIQVWARKKFAATHEEGDTYELYGPVGYNEGGCPTCGNGGAYTELDVHRRRKNKVSIVESFRDISLVWFLNEILNPLESLE